MTGLDPGLARHVAACNDAVLPGGRVAFRIGRDQVGWLHPDAAKALLTFSPPARGGKKV